jgi:hypothetical protein
LAALAEHGMLSDINKDEAFTCKLGAKNIGMITLEDCVAFCGLTNRRCSPSPSTSICPEIAAAALAEYLTCQERGRKKFVT